MRLETLDGTVLATGETNANGAVFFRQVQVPSNFRVVATVPGSNVELSAQIRGFQGNNKQARVSLLTTLADRYAQAHPDQGIEEAERIIKRLTNLPMGVDVSLGPEEINPFYSDIALLRAAGLNGGWEAYSESLLGQNSTTGPGTYFLLSPSQLNRPITGLEPGLQETAESIRQALATRLGVQQEIPTEMLGTEILASFLTGDGPASLGGQILLGVGAGLGTNLLSDGINGVIGWAANQMGLNYGTSGQLKEIESELSSLITLVESFEETQVTSDLTDDFNTLQGFFSQVENTTGQLRDQANITEITNTPVSFSSSDPLTTLLNALNSQNYTSALTNANNNLLGPTEFLMSYQNTYLNMKLGLDTPSNKQGVPWRSNHILDVINGVFGHFSNLQVQALNLLAEQAHTYPTNPGTAVPSLRLGMFAETLSNLKKQRQQLSLYASQWGAIVDLEYGLMWWETMQNPDTFANAQDYASSFQTQLIFPDGSTRTYDDWRLPGYGDCVSLQLRGSYNPSPGDPTFTGTDTSDTVGGVPVNSKSSYPDTGQSTAGLPNLGFYQVRQALTAAPNDNGNNGDMWFQQTVSNGAEIVLQDNWEFRMNHGTNDTNRESKSSDTNVYLICRTFGPTNLNGESLSYFDGSNLTAGEIAQWGVPTSMTISDVQSAPSSISVPGNSTQGEGSTTTVSIPENSLNLTADITYTLNIGGSFTHGFGSTKSESRTASSYQATVSTSQNSNGNPNSLAELVNWGVDNPEALYVLNLPFTGGIAIPYQATEVNLTASLLGAGGTQISNSKSYTIATTAPKTLTGIVITPRNQIYGGSGSVPSSGANAKQQYFCTGFYSDWSVADLSTVVTWSVPTNPANAQIVVDGQGASLELNQPPEANPTPYTLDITATHEDSGLTDTVTIQIVPQVQ